MKAKLIACVALFSVAASAGAAERAVEAVHYQLGLDGQFFDYNSDDLYANGDGKAVGSTLQGEVTLPLGPYTGVSLGASFAKFYSEDDDGQTEIEDATTRGVAQLFYRHPSIGRLSVGYMDVNEFKPTIRPITARTTFLTPILPIATSLSSKATPARLPLP